MEVTWPAASVVTYTYLPLSQSVIIDIYGRMDICLHICSCRGTQVEFETEWTSSRGLLRKWMGGFSKRSFQRDIVRVWDLSGLKDMFHVLVQFVILSRSAVSEEAAACRSEGWQMVRQSVESSAKRYRGFSRESESHNLVEVSNWGLIRWQPRGLRVLPPGRQ